VLEGLGVTEAYTGLNVSQLSATDVRMASGRYWRDGLRYLLDGPADISMLPHLPATGSKRIVSIVVYGDEQDTDVETRRFLVDATPGAETSEPRPTATRTRRLLHYSLIPGLQGPSGTLPAIPPGNLEVCRVLLDEAGVRTITMIVGPRLVSLGGLRAIFDAMNTAFSKVRGDVASLRSDLADLVAQVKLKAAEIRVDHLAATVAQLVHRMDVSGVYIGLHKNPIQDTDLADTAHGSYAGILDYGGFRFPYATSQDTALALLNPVDPTLKISTGGLVLPNYTEVDRVTNEDYADQVRPIDASSAAYNFTMQGKPRTYIHYGAFSDRNWIRPDFPSLATVRLFNPLTDAYESLSVDPTWRLQALKQIRGAAKIRITDPTPALATSVVTKTGAAVAQSLLNSRLGWLTSIGIGFWQIGSTGVVNVALCGLQANGVPDLNQCMALSVANVADLKQVSTDGFSYVPIEPVLLRPGERYAVVIVTAGSHVLGASDAGRNMQGAVFHYLDGAAFAPTMLADKDLCMSLRFAEFANPRVVTSMAALSLVGGIENLTAALAAYEPNGTELTFEAQVGGVWRPLDASDLTAFSTAPNLIPLRMVFKGSAFAMPAVYLGGNSRAIVFRRADAAVWVSSAFVNGGGSNDITLRVRLRNYRAAVHSVTAHILTGAGFTTSTASASSSYEKDFFANGDDLMSFAFAPGSVTTAKFRLDLATTAHGETFQITNAVDIER
jgi:hypothetical protein